MCFDSVTEKNLGGPKTIRVGWKVFHTPHNRRRLHFERFKLPGKTTTTIDHGWMKSHTRKIRPTDGEAYPGGFHVFPRKTETLWLVVRKQWWSKEDQGITNRGIGWRCAWMWRENCGCQSQTFGKTMILHLF